MSEPAAARVAIVGANGQLGTALREVLADRELIVPSHAELPFEHSDAVARLLDRERPDVLINCSAFHQVDVCEREPERAFAVNALAVDGAAELCAARGAAFMTISTDYVFDGTLGRAYREDDAPNPRTAYGVSKLAGELLTRRHGPRHWIVRTSGVFGDTGTSSKGYTLVEKMLQKAERGEPITMVADQVFSPSYAPHVARAIRALIDAHAYGTYHVANAGACSWFDFVRTALDKAGLTGAAIAPTTYAALDNPTPRPMYSPLTNTTFARAGIAPLPPWEAALDAFVARRAARTAPVSAAERARAT